MTNKEKKERLSVKYPLTIIRDRYDGVYSRACWLAFPLDYDEIPEDVDGDDVVCSLFWKTYKKPVGKGAYANDAVIDLMERMEAPEFPEESEDERHRKWILEYLYDGLRKADEQFKDHFKAAIAYLEKQKENPKSADSIQSDCVSNAKCENRWYKVGDFLPDNGRDVLAKDALSNYLIAHYDGDQWFISGYDNEDKPIVYTPAIIEWCDISSEKQKEQKHPDGCFTCDEYKKGYDTGRLNGFTAGYNKAMKEQKSEESISQLTVQGKGVYKICPRCKERMIRDDSKVYTSMPPQYGYECPKCGEMEFDTVMYDSPEMEKQKPAEWSKNDTVFLNEITDFFENKTSRLQHDIDMYAHWLKSLPERFSLQPKQEWSEEDEAMRADTLDSLRRYQLSKPNYQVELQMRWLRSLPERFNLQAKQEWSEEDVKRLYSIGTQIGFLKGKYSEYQKDIDWLYALAEKMGFHKCKIGEVVTEWKKEDIDDKMLSKSKQEWSEEDEKIRKALVWHLKADVDFVSNGVTKAECLAYLDKQKVQKQEWSDEDKRILKGIIGLVDHNQHYNVSNKEMLAWLKSLRPSWKPSEEQMEELNKVRTLNPSLDALYQQLKNM